VPSGVYAVVVLYRPDEALLHQQFVALRRQVEGVVYVDNGSGRPALREIGIVDDQSVTDGQSLTNDHSILDGQRMLDDQRVLDDPSVTVLGDGANLGLSTALNNALTLLADKGIEFALLLDQDSLPEPDMVRILLRGFASSSAVRRPVAAVGPAIRDVLHDNAEYFVRLGLPANRRIRSAADAGTEFFEVDFLITSGTLLHVPALADVGLMDESLFIDSIDFDWSFHARSRGYALLATFSAAMRHRRGDEIRRAPGGLSIRVHSASRLYFMHRNRLRLYTRNYVPLAWKIHDFGRMLVKMGLLVVFVPNRFANLRAISRGIRDGLLQRGGDGP
jgi:rhamnosyltransferase